MPHLFHDLDWSVAVFVVHAGRILLVHHRKLDRWLPLGGHVEIGEDPEAAAHREVLEESGLRVELIGERPPTSGEGTRALVSPRFMDVHRISATHEHIGIIYWARPAAGADPEALVPAAAEHHDLRRFQPGELAGLNPPMSPAVCWYCERALLEIK
jgi:8-oxo-dGTP pyrophosphatase MutT (NUDIX family)